jgi:hypothetical protein
MVKNNKFRITRYKLKDVSKLKNCLKVQKIIKIKVLKKQINVKLKSKVIILNITGRKTKNRQDYLAKKALPIFAYFCLFSFILAYSCLFSSILIYPQIFTN